MERTRTIFIFARHMEGAVIEFQADNGEYDDSEEHQ